MEMAPDFTNFRGFNFQPSKWGEKEVSDFYKDKWANIGKEEVKRNASELSELVAEELGGRMGVIRRVTAENRTGGSDNLERLERRKKSLGIDNNTLHGFEQSFISPFLWTGRGR